MRVLGRRLEDIDYAFLRELAETQTAESRTHEYRSVLPPARDEKQRTRYLEAIASFANTDGGVLIFGFREQRWEVWGLDRFDLDGDVRRLDELARRLDPPLPALVPGPRISTPDGRPLLLLGVRRSLAAPHGVVFPDQHTVYFRRNNRGKYTMSTAELRMAFLEQDHWRREAIEFVHARVDQRKPTSTPLLMLHLLPLGRLEVRLDVAILRDIAQQHFGSLFARGSVNRHMSLDGLTFTNLEDGGEITLRCFRHGGIELVAPLTRFPALHGPGILAGDGIVALIRSAVDAGVRWLTARDIEPPFALFTALIRVQNVRLTDRWQDPPPAGASFDRNLVRLPTLVIDSPSSLASILDEATALLWQAAGRFSPPAASST